MIADSLCVCVFALILSCAVVHVQFFFYLFCIQKCIVKYLIHVKCVCCHSLPKCVHEFPGHQSDLDSCVFVCLYETFLCAHKCKKLEMSTNFGSGRFFIFIVLFVYIKTHRHFMKNICRHVLPLVKLCNYVVGFSLHC